jgi:hypothetical protein
LNLCVVALGRYLGGKGVSQLAHTRRRASSSRAADAEILCDRPSRLARIARHRNRQYPKRATMAAARTTFEAATRR